MHIDHVLTIISEMILCTSMFTARTKGKHEMDWFGGSPKRALKALSSVLHEFQKSL